MNKRLEYEDVRKRLSDEIRVSEDCLLALWKLKENDVNKVILWSNAHSRHIVIFNSSKVLRICKELGIKVR